MSRSLAGLVLVLAVSGIAKAQTSGAVASAEEIVGIWEMTRFDNLRPGDAAPGEFPNMYVAFSSGGTLKFWFPTSAEPHEGMYRLDTTRFTGWLGLTNDLTGAATASFATRDRLELVYPDESIASFKRLSRKPTDSFERRFHCIPYTVRGQTFDQRTVQELKKLGDSLRAGSDPAPALVGTWILIVEKRPVLVLEVSKDQASMRGCPSVLVAGVPEHAERQEGPLRVFDNYLVTTAIACGQPIRFETSSTRLILQISVTERLKLVRAAPDDVATICP